MNLTITIEQDNLIFDVELDGEIEMIDDTFDHEFGTRYFEPYPQLKDFPTWNHDFYSFSENWIIAIYIYYNFLSIEKQFCNLERSFANDFIND